MNDEARLPLSWTAVLHMLNTQKSPYARFFNTLSHHCQAFPIKAPVPSCSQFEGWLPMRMPFPEVEQHLELKCRSRRRGREVSRIVAKRWTNRIIALFGFYSMGHQAFDLCASVASRPLSVMQLDFCQLLEADVMQWVRSPTGLGLLNDGGRCAKFSVILNKLHSDGYSHNTPVEALCTTAMAVVPDRISLPENAGGCNPADYLAEPMRSEFLDVSNRTLPPHLWDDIPKPCHRVSVKDEMGTLDKVA